MEIFEYFEYIFRQKNEAIAKILEDTLNKIDEEDEHLSSIRRDISLALGVSKGYTEYKAKELAETLGVSKTAIKFMINKLKEENKIELIKENNITFIKPIF